MSGETTRAAGIRFERKVGTALRDDGYRTNRGAGSKGFADFVAVKPGQQLFVACKLSGICSATEWDDLFEVASWVGAVPVLAVNGPRGRGVDYWRLTGRKVARAPMGRQPAERFLTDEVVPPEPSWHRQEWVDTDEPARPSGGPESLQGSPSTGQGDFAALRSPAPSAIGIPAPTVDP